MEKVSINLIPQEVSIEQAKQDRFGKVQYVSIGVILLIILVASISVSLRIFQSQTIKRLQTQITSLETQVESFKQTEISLTLLKNRLNTITQLLSKPAKQTAIYNLISDKIPPDVEISSIAVDRLGDIVITLTIPNSGVLQATLDNFTSEETFQKVAKVDLESLSGGRDGLFRLNVKITNK